MCQLILTKSKGETVLFEFVVHQFKVKENGRVFTKVIQTGLGVFAKTLEGYLTVVGAERHLNKLSEEELGDTQADSWM